MKSAVVRWALTVGAVLVVVAILAFMLHWHEAMQEPVGTRPAWDRLR